MDASHAALALGGAVLGWWGKPSADLKAEPAVCQCHRVVPHPGARSDQVAGLFRPAILLVVILVGTNLVLVFRVNLQQAGGVSREISLSVKGRPGKGVLGASQGLQLVDN